MKQVFYSLVLKKRGVYHLLNDVSGVIDFEFTYSRVNESWYFKQLSTSPLNSLCLREVYKYLQFLEKEISL